LAAHAGARSLLPRRPPVKPSLAYLLPFRRRGESWSTWTNG
jgi:hypothetical protein